MVGGSKVVRQSPKDKVALIGAGVTLHNCIAAADALAAKKIPVRVIDLCSVKPVDVKTLRDAARVTKGRLVVVEDHYPEGGIGAAVTKALPAPRPTRQSSRRRSAVPPTTTRRWSSACGKRRSPPTCCGS